MQERVPNLPEVDPAELGSLRTLGEIVGRLGTNGVAPLASPAAAPPAAPAPEQTIAPIERLVVEPIETPAPGFSLPHLFDGHTLTITDEGSGVAQALAECLLQHGIRSEVSTEVAPDAPLVIVLDGLRRIAHEEAAIAVNLDAFRIATTVASHFEQGGRSLVLVQDTGGDFAFGGRQDHRAWLGGLTGLAKTAAQEWPESTVRAIDLERGDRTAQQLARVLANELLTGGDEVEIGLPAAGGRLSLQMRAVLPTGGQPCVDGDSVLVVSGGARGVTAASLLELARQAHPRIALLGRTILKKEPACCHDVSGDAALKQALLRDAQSRGEQLTPADLGRMTSRIQSRREICATLDALGEAGAEAQYFSCDIGDAQLVNQTLLQVRDTFGPITGIVHGAGVLADKMLSQKTDEQFSWVFGAKVAGLHNLLAATREDPLRMICMFSSVAARAGNAGQSDYAMANEVLNRVAHHEAGRRVDCVVKTINWGPWKSGMVTAALEQKFAEMGVPLIPLDDGARRFVDELQRAAPGEIETVVGGIISSPQPRIARRLEVVVDAQSHPYLTSHQVQGTVVLPLVLAQEWLLRAASTTCPDRVLARCSKLRVLRGIQLTSFGQQSERFEILVEQPGPDTLSLSLRDTDGTPRYACEITLADIAPTPSEIPAPELPWVEIAGDALYGDKLFHGPAFAALREVQGLGDQGAQAELIGAAQLNWPADRWLSDPALLDGGLQLARIWGFEILGRPTLPTSLGEFIRFQDGLAQSPVSCVLTGEKMGKTGTRTNLWFVDAAGAVIAEIHGLEMHVTQEAVSLTN